jgi:hypothetical protein
MAIDRNEALAAAREDAVRVYGSLEPYREVVEFRDGSWFVDYELLNPSVQGGGPHYVIDAETGEITHRRYEQ